MLQAFEDKVVVKPEKPKETVGGILIPDSARVLSDSGIVVSVGEGRWREHGEGRVPVGIAVGQKVYYGKHSGVEVEYEGEKYKVIRQHEVLSVSDANGS